MSRRLLVLTASLLVLFLSGCEPVNNDPGDNPLPTLTSLSPTAKTAHLPPFTLTAKGSDFVQGSQVIFAGAAMPTTYVNASEITCQVGPNQLLTAASTAGETTLEETPAAKKTVEVYVHNPSPGGGDSAAIDFTINSDHTFDQSKNISNTSANSSSPRIAADHLGIVHVAWAEEASANPAVYYTRSTNGGSTWSSPVDLSNHPAAVNHPILVKPENSPSTDVHLIWTSTAAGVTKNILSTSNDSGATWLPPVELTSSAVDQAPIICIDGAGNLNAAWAEENPVTLDIFFSRCTNLDTGWSTPVTIYYNSNNSTSPALAVTAAGTLFTAWLEESAGSSQIVISRSNDNGATWSAPWIIAKSKHAGQIRILPGSTNECFITWKESDSSQACPDTFFYSSRSTDNGITWSSKTLLFSIGCNYAGDAQVVDSAGNVNAAVSDYNRASAAWEAYFFRSIDAFNSWSTPLKFSLSSTDAALIDMAVDNLGNVYIAWDNSEKVTKAEIYFTSSSR